MISATTHCLTPALSAIRTGLSKQATWELVKQVPESCERPDVCANREMGCRLVNVEWLKAEYARAALAAKRKMAA